jgi:hypothetical protein
MFARRLLLIIEARFALRTRLSALGFILFMGLLAACSSGGGSPSPAPTATPANGSYRPAASGDAFGYAGTMTEAFVRPPVPTGGVTPNPNPTDTETLVTAVTQAVTVSAPAASQYDFHVVETDNLNNGLETSTVTSDEIYNYAASGASTDVELASYTSTSSSGVVDAATIGAGNGLVDILPEVSGPILPNNTFAQTLTETEPDGTGSTTTTFAGGTYTENGTANGSFPGNPLPTLTTVNADGSGSYQFPFIIPEDSSYTVSAPSPGPSPGSEQINIVLSVPAILVESAPSPNATPVAIAVGPVPVWYPLPLVLANQTQTNNGAVALPASCNVPAALTKTANQIVQATTTVDPVFGETDVNTTTAYTEPGIGVACLTLSDVVTQYYDLSGQTQGFSQGDLGFQNTPFQTTTTAETLGITSATVLGLSSAGRSPQDAAVRATRFGLRAGVAHFRAVLAKHRAARHREFYRALAARAKGGLR